MDVISEWPLMLETYYPDIVYSSDIEESDNDQSDQRCCKVKCTKLFCRMEVFSMLKNSIVSEDSNPILRHFEIGRQVGSCGPEMIWKIYEAFRIDDKKVKGFVCKLTITIDNFLSYVNINFYYEHARCIWD